jgi:hypothetical protein
MSFFCRLSRKHYWCTPHRTADNRLVQVCYECGAERPARELHKEGVSDQHSPFGTSKTDAPRRAMPRAVSRQPIATANQPLERRVVGQGSRRFVIVK